MTKQVNRDLLKPVMVFIHGGVFMFGNGNDAFGPDYIMDRNVVLVTINYRLAAFGDYVNLFIVKSKFIS